MNAASSGSVTHRSAHASAADTASPAVAQSGAASSASMAVSSRRQVVLSECEPIVRVLNRSPLQNTQHVDACVCGAAAATPTITASRLSKLPKLEPPGASEHADAHKAGGHWGSPLSVCEEHAVNIHMCAAVNI